MFVFEPAVGLSVFTPFALKWSKNRQSMCINLMRLVLGLWLLWYLLEIRTKGTREKGKNVWKTLFQLVNEVRSTNSLVKIYNIERLWLYYNGCRSENKSPFLFPLFFIEYLPNLLQVPNKQEKLKVSTKMKNVLYLEINLLINTFSNLE